MNIVICAKFVKSEIVYKEVDRNDVYVFNPYDLYALEQCLLLKKRYEECNITIISMGPFETQPLLVKALAMGCDEAILLNDSAFIGSDTVATSYIISCAIKKMNKVDLVVCGAQSIDGETGQVVFGLAERLQFNCIRNIKSFLAIEQQQLLLEQEVNRLKARISVSTPVVIALKEFTLKQPDISLVALKKAKQRTINIWRTIDINADIEKSGLKGSKTKVMGIQNVLKKRNQSVVEGSIADKAKFMRNILYGRCIHTEIN